MTSPEEDSAKPTIREMAQKEPMLTIIPGIRKIFGTLVVTPEDVTMNEADWGPGRLKSWPVIEHPDD